MKLSLRIIKCENTVEGGVILVFLERGKDNLLLWIFQEVADGLRTFSQGILWFLEKKTKNKTMITTN